MLKTLSITQTPDVIITQGDVGEVGIFTLTRADDTPVLLENTKKIEASLKHKGEALFTRDMSIKDAVNGVVTFSLTEADVLPAGVILVQVAVTWVNDNVDIFPKGSTEYFYLHVKNSLGILEATLPVKDPLTCPPSYTTDLQLF